VRQLRIRAEPAGGDFSQDIRRSEELREVRRVETPHATTIEELAELLDVAKARTAKIVFLAAEDRNEDGELVVGLIVAVSVVTRT